MTPSSAAHPLGQRYLESSSAASSFGSLIWLRDSPLGSTQRSEEHTSELQSRENLVCRLLRPPRSPLSPYTTLFRSRRYPRRSPAWSLRSEAPSGSPGRHG